ncbi:MAG: nicotinate-nucleotide adenylyltransferase [bacterium]
MNSDRIGLMGGTFNPIHYGHLVAAEEARHQFNLDQVIFIPSGQPPHRMPRTVIPAEDRYIMTALAIATNPYFNISRIEIERPGPSYTIDTVRAFKEMYPRSELFFITGLDAILEILTWRDPYELVRLAHFIAVTRPGYNPECLKNLDEEILDNVSLLEIPGYAISSTLIRERVAQGKPIRYMVPEPVEAYIRKHGLYRQ